jgi:hypothetical protein
MSLEVVVTSTALCEEETENLKDVLENYPERTRYSADLTSEVRILVVNKGNQQNDWIKSKKFMYVTSYRPDVRVVDFKEICNFQKYCKVSLLTFPQIKPFDNLTISLCRLEDDLLDKIEKIISQNGGTVIHHLTNETDVMISMIAEGRRYDAALSWGISVVSPDWCYDSVDRGLPLNTKFYKLSKNVTDYVKKLNYENEDDKVGNEFTVKTYQLGKRDQACDWEKLKEWRDHEQDRKLEEYIKIKFTNKNKHKKGDENNSENESYTMLNTSLDLDLGLKRKIDELENDASEDTIVKIKKKSKVGEFWNSVLHKQNLENGGKFKNQNVFIKKEVTKGPILKDLKFKTLGFTASEESKLIKVISKFGGTVIDDDTSDDSVDFTVVSFKYNKPVEGENMITELAIERFIYNERVDLGNYLWCKPFTISADNTITEFRHFMFSKKPELHSSTKKITVSITGFQGTDLSQVERLFKERLSQWLDFHPIFTKQSELLVIGPSCQASVSSLRKKQLAQRWQIIAISVEEFFARIVEIGAPKQKC